MAETLKVKGLAEGQQDNIPEPKPAPTFHHRKRKEFSSYSPSPYDNSPQRQISQSQTEVPKKTSAIERSPNVIQVRFIFFITMFSSITYSRNLIYFNSLPRSFRMLNPIYTKVIQTMLPNLPNQILNSGKRSTREPKTWIPTFFPSRLVISNSNLNLLMTTNISPMAHLIKCPKILPKA